MHNLTRKIPRSVKNNNVRRLNNEFTRPNSTICVVHIVSICLIHKSSHNNKNNNNRIENYLKKNKFPLPSRNCISNGHIAMQLAPLYSHPSVLWWSFLCQPILEPSICLSTAILPLSVLLAPFLPLHYPRPSPKTAGCTLQTPFSVNFTSILLSLRTPWPFTHPAIENGVHFFCEQLEHFPFRFSNYYHCFKQERLWKNPKGETFFNGLSLKLTS